jgi:hypothetical protein
MKLILLQHDKLTCWTMWAFKICWPKAYSYRSWKGPQQWTWFEHQNKPTTVFNEWDESCVSQVWGRECYIIVLHTPSMIPLNMDACVRRIATAQYEHYHFHLGPYVPLVGSTPRGRSTPPHHCVTLGALGCRARYSGGNTPRMLSWLCTGG